MCKRARTPQPTAPSRKEKPTSGRVAAWGAAALGAVLLSFGCAHGNGNSTREFDAGFLATRDRDVQGNKRVRALGPLIEHRAQPGAARFTAVRPFYSRSVDPGQERARSEMLWPVATTRTFHHERQWRILLAHGRNYDQTEPGGRYQFMLFPVIFAGRDAEHRPYLGVFPVGGRVRGLLFQDRIDFVLFPLYATAVKGDQQRRHVLWPVLSWGDSPRQRHFGVFPFYGRTERAGRWDKRYIAWPFWVSARYTEPGAEGRVRMLWPLFWRAKLETERTWMFLPPLFRFTKTEELVRVHAPWPFFQRYSGPTEKLYLWPLWGRKSDPHSEQWFLLWPLVSRHQQSRPRSERSRFTFMPFLHHHTTTRPPPASAESATAPPSVEQRYFELWPLFAYRRDGESAQWRAPTLWPGRDLPPLQRNWTPLWTLYTRERQGDMKEDEALWGLFRYRRDDRHTLHVSLFPLFRYRRDASAREQRSWSLLAGLLGHERGELQNTWRLLYFPIRYGKGEASPAH